MGIRKNKSRDRWLKGDKECVRDRRGLDDCKCRAVVGGHEMAWFMFEVELVCGWLEAM